MPIVPAGKEEIGAGGDKIFERRVLWGRVPGLSPAACLKASSSLYQPVMPVTTDDRRLQAECEGHLAHVEILDRRLRFGAASKVSGLPQLSTVTGNANAGADSTVSARARNCLFHQMLRAWGWACMGRFWRLEHHEVAVLRWVAQAQARQGRRRRRQRAASAFGRGAWRLLARALCMTATCGGKGRDEAAGRAGRRSVVTSSPATSDSNSLRALGIEVVGRFIKKQDSRLLGDGPRQLYALTLAARQRSDARRREHARSSRDAVASATISRFAVPGEGANDGGMRPERYIVFDEKAGAPGVSVWPTKANCRARSSGVKWPTLLSLRVISPDAGWRQAGQHAQQGRLAGTVRSDDRQPCAAFDSQGRLRRPRFRPAMR